MKTVKNLSVTVTYKVALGDVEMPEKVYAQIVDAAEKGREIEGTGGKHYSDASEWLSSNIKERDCFEWSTEIDEVS